MSNVIHADCLDALRAMPDASVTAIVTDPPYGLEFMGKGWDKVLPPVDVWRECLRVLRPGGHALIFGGTRTYHRLAVSVEDAGFEIRDCLMWLYGSGFPKGHNVSKAIDKDAGAEREKVPATGGLHGNRNLNDDGWSKIGAAAPTMDSPVPVTEAAKLWDGWSTALKPAWEPILLARKPLVGTVAENCQQHGTGALNIDGCRIGPGHQNGSGREGEASAARRYPERGDTNIAATPGPRGGDPAGRWPANLVLDEAAAAELDEQAPDKGQAAPLKMRNANKMGRTAYGKFEGSADADFQPHDAPGGASRFFYCAKASKSDRGEGNTHPTVKPVELMRWLVRLLKGPGDNLILDPFAGSGSTGVAAALEDVPCVLIEREAAYVEIIRKRLEQQTP